MYGIFTYIWVMFKATVNIGTLSCAWSIWAMYMRYFECRGLTKTLKFISAPQATKENLYHTQPGIGYLQM